MSRSEPPPPPAAPSGDINALIGSLSPEEKALFAEIAGGSAGSAASGGDGRFVPYGPRRRDTPTPENAAKLTDDKYDIPADPAAAKALSDALPDDAERSLLAQDRAAADRAAGTTDDHEYALGGQDFAAANRAVGSDAPGAEESRDTMERDTTKTAAFLKMEALRMEDDEIRRIAQEMVDAGLLPEDYDRQGFNVAWAKLVDLAADWHEANPGSYLTPEDMIDVYAGQRGTGAIGSKRKPGEPGGPTATDVLNSVTLSDSTQAWGMLRDMIKSELGRAPTDAEVDSFQAALNDAQTRAPVVTTTKTKTDLAGNQTVNRLQTGGMDEEGYTENYVHDEMDAEYGAYQSATTYFNAFTDAIGRTV